MTEQVLLAKCASGGRGTSTSAGASGGSMRRGRCPTGRRHEHEQGGRVVRCRGARRRASVKVRGAAGVGIGVGLCVCVGVCTRTGAAAAAGADGRRRGGIDGRRGRFQRNELRVLEQVLLVVEQLLLLLLFVRGRGGGLDFERTVPLWRVAAWNEKGAQRRMQKSKSVVLFLTWLSKELGNNIANNI